MEEYRCKTPKCNKVLFEGNFVGTIIKKCPKCKETNKFINLDCTKLEKICNLEKNP